MADKPIPFLIKAIGTREFATIKDAYKEGEEIDIKTKFNFGVGRENHTIVILLDLTFESNKTPFVILKTRMEFEIEAKAFEKLKNKDGGAVVVPKGFLTHLAALNISTARGILHSKLQGTDFNHILLPALDVSQVLKEDMKFEFTS